MGFSPPFSASVESRNAVIRIALTGELDLASAPVLKDLLSQAEGDGSAAIMLDLRGVTFIDSTGLHAFVRARKRAQENGHRLILVGANEQARKLFELTGTESLLDGEEAVSVLDQFTGSRARRSGQRALQDGQRDG